MPHTILEHDGYRLWARFPGDHGDTVSAATLLLKAKFFDDRLYAAVELAAQQGMGRFAGKAALRPPWQQL